MNILKTALFFTLIIASSFNIHILSKPTTPWYKLIAHECTYAINCHLINAAHTLSHATAKLTNYNPDRLQQEITAIECQLKKYKTDILQEEQNALVAIKNRFAIPDHLWHEYLQTSADIKKYNTTELQKPSGNADHDPTLPNHMYKTVITLLKKHNINPSNIRIKKSTKSSNHLVHTVSYLKHHLVNTDTVPKIVFFEKALSASKKQFIALCAHEIEHFIQQHRTTKRCVIACIQEHANIPEDVIKNSAEYQKLVQIQEAQAEILPALRDPHTAHCMKTLRQTLFYPHYLYANHYYQLSCIDKLWKLHTHLNNLSTKR